MAAVGHSHTAQPITVVRSSCEMSLPPETVSEKVQLVCVCYSNGRPLMLKKFTSLPQLMIPCVPPSWFIAKIIHSVIHYVMSSAYSMFYCGTTERQLTRILIARMLIFAVILFPIPRKIRSTFAFRRSEPRPSKSFVEALTISRPCAATCLKS